MNRRAILCGLLALLSPSAAVTAENPTAFVQRFYDTYLKRDAPNWGKTARVRPGLFASELAAALQQDAAAQAKVSDEIVGLDFDPFLGSQDPGKRFVARGAVATSAGYRVAVYDLEMSSRGKPAVLVDVASRDGSWVITDFRYPGTSGELLSTLRLLQKSRTSHRLR